MGLRVGILNRLIVFSHHYPTRGKLLVATGDDVVIEHLVRPPLAKGCLDENVEQSLDAAGIPENRVEMLVLVNRQQN